MVVNRQVSTPHGIGHATSEKQAFRTIDNRFINAVTDVGFSKSMLLAKDVRREKRHLLATAKIEMMQGEGRFSLADGAWR